MNFKALSLLVCFTCAASLRILPENPKLLTKGERGKCPAFNGKRVVLVNVDKDYASQGFLFNWYHYAKEHIAAEKAQLVIDIPDKQVSELLKIDTLADDVVVIGDNQQLTTIGQLRKDKSVKFAKDAKDEADGPWGSDTFINLVSKRRLVQSSALLKKDCNVLQVDVDMVWKVNPFKDVDAIVGNNQLVLTDDSDKGHMDKPDQVKNWYMCTCFMYMKPELADGTFLSEWAAETKKHTYEQYGLNALLRNHVSGKGFSRAKQNPEFTHLDWVVLPWEHYSNGPSTKAGSHVVHANWIRSQGNKAKFLKKKGVWAKETEEWLHKQGSKKFFEQPDSGEIEFVVEPSAEFS